ncbi:protein of unknown function [Pararobbsia alpina]
MTAIEAVNMQAIMAVKAKRWEFMV